ARRESEDLVRAEVECIIDQGMAARDTHDGGGFATIFADNFVVNGVASPDPITDKDGVRAYAHAWFTAFPDMSVKQTNRVVSDDAVAAEVEFTGTNSGPMMMAGKEIPPTGKSGIGRGTNFARLRGGKVAEFNACPDNAGEKYACG